MALLTSSRARLLSASSASLALITLGAAPALVHIEHTLFIGPEHRAARAAADVIAVFSMVISTSSGNDCSQQKGL